MVINGMTHFFLPTFLGKTKAPVLTLTVSSFNFHFSLSPQIFSCTFSHFLISLSFISLQTIRLFCPAIICKLLLWLIKIHMRVMWLRSLYLSDSFFFAFSAKPCFRIVLWLNFKIKV